MASSLHRDHAVEGGFTLDGMKFAVENKKVRHGPVIRPFKATQSLFVKCTWPSLLCRGPAK